MTLDDRIIAHSKGFHVDELDDRSLRNIMDSVINQYHRQETALRELIQNALGAFATDSHMFFEKVNDGGVYRIRYVDNGIGMSKDDALNLLLRAFNSDKKFDPKRPGEKGIGFLSLFKYDTLMGVEVQSKKEGHDAWKTVVSSDFKFGYADKFIESDIEEGTEVTIYLQMPDEVTARRLNHIFTDDYGQDISVRVDNYDLEGGVVAFSDVYFAENYVIPGIQEMHRWCSAVPNETHNVHVHPFGFKPETVARAINREYDSHSFVLNQTPVPRDISVPVVMSDSDLAEEIDVTGHVSYREGSRKGVARVRQHDILVQNYGISRNDLEIEISSPHLRTVLSRNAFLEDEVHSAVMNLIERRVDGFDRDFTVSSLGLQPNNFRGIDDLTLGERAVDTTYRAITNRKYVMRAAKLGAAAIGFYYLKDCGPLTIGFCAGALLAAKPIYSLGRKIFGKDSINFWSNAGKYTTRAVAAGALALMIFGFGKGVYEGFYDIKPKTQRTPGVQVVQVEENIHLDPNVTYSQLQERIRTSEKDSDQSLVGTGALFFEEGLKENGRNFLETMYDGASWLVGSVVDFTSGLGKGFINLFVDHGSEIVTGRAPARYERDPASLVDIVVPQVSRTVSFEPPTQENDAFAKAHRETQLVYAIHGMGHYLKTGTYDHLNSDGVFVALRDKDPITSMKMFGLDDLWEYKRTLRDVKSPFALDWNERSALTTDQVVDRIVSSVKQEMTYTKDILDGLGLEMSKLVRNNMQVYLEKKMGVCLDFAQVAAYSLRESGVPSRVVVGAVGDVGHAWIEWYSTEKDMWVPVEVTDPKKTNDPPYWPVALGLLGIGGVIFGRHRIKRSLRKRYRLDSNLFSDDELSREYDLLSLNMSELKFFEQRLFGRKGHSSTLGFNKEAMKKFKKTMIREHLPDYIQALMSKPIVYAHNYGAPLSMFDLVEIGEREGEILYSNENTSTTPHYTQKRIPVLDMGSLTSTTQSFVRGCVESVLGYKLASVDQDSHFHIFEDERELSEPERSLVDRVEGVLALDRKIKRKTKAVKPGKFDYHIRNSTPRLAKYQSGTLYLNMNHPLIVGLGNGNPTPIDKLAIDVVLDVSTDDGLVNPGSKYFAKLGKHTQNAALN